ncbi:MAG: TolB family protein, partial [Thermomicrobiales bacterium]
MRQLCRTILAALLLATVTLHPAAAQQATPPAELPERREVKLPDARIVALSPDGTRFVASKSAGARLTDLCVYDVATLTEQTCGDLEARRIAISLDSVVWSPDSTKITFAEDAFRIFVDGDLWLMDAATGELTNVTDDGYEGRIEVWDDDEEWPETPIHVDILPAWAPDSRSIAFSRSPIFNGEFRGNQIVSLDLASGEVETLAPVTLAEPGVVYFGLAWAPDGQRLYYSVAYPESDNTQNGIWVYDRV